MKNDVRRRNPHQNVSVAKAITDGKPADAARVIVGVDSSGNVVARKFANEAMQTQWLASVQNLTEISNVL